MTRNPVRARWEQGAAAYGAWCSTASPFVVELLVRGAPDFVLLDAQHGMFGIENLVECLRAVPVERVAPVVRLASGDAAAIGRVLDLGALGVVVPMVESAEDAARAVAACRYHPDGVRSFGPLRTGLHLGRDPQVLATEPLCLVMIETARGVENVEDIVTVPGVDGVFLGPADLAISYGLAPSMAPLPGVHAEAIAGVLKACRARGLGVGLPCADGASAREMVAAGHTFVTVGSDAQWISAAASAAFDHDIRDTKDPTEETR